MTSFGQQQEWKETGFESTAYGKKKDRDDGVFKNYDYVWKQPNGLYVVKKKVYFANNVSTLNSFLMDKNGNILTKRVYTDIGDFSEGMAEVTVGAEDFCRSCFDTGRYRYVSLLNRSCGFINERGEEVISPKYEYVQGGFSHGYCLVGYAGKLFFINKKEEIRFNKTFTYGEAFRGNIAEVVYKGDKKNFINDKGENLIPKYYEYIQPFSRDYRGMIRAYQPAGGKVGFWTADCKPFIDPQYDKFSYSLLSESIMVSKNGKIGFIDYYTGRYIIPEIYEAYRKDVTIENVLLKNGHTWYRADKNGGIVILSEAEDIAGLGRGIYKILTKENSWKLIDSIGNPLTDKSYEKIADKFENDFLRITHHNKGGYLNYSGQEVISPEYERLGKFQSGQVIVEKGIHWFVFNEEGALLEKGFTTRFVKKVIVGVIIFILIAVTIWFFRKL